MLFSIQPWFLLTLITSLKILYAWCTVLEIQELQLIQVKKIDINIGTK